MTQSTAGEDPSMPIPPAGRAKRLRRLLGYAGWTFAAAALPLALDRLLVHPFLSRGLGEVRFSALVWVLALINIVGLIGFNGFAILLMRDFATRPIDEGRRLFRTATVLTFGLTVVVISLTVAVAWPWMPGEVRAEAGPLLIGFACYGVVRAVGMILVTHLRIRRRFKWVFVVRAVEAGVLLINLLVVGHESMWLIAIIYIASMLLPLPLGAFAARDVVGPGRWWSTKAARWLMAGWFAGAAISLIDQAQVYIPRLLLGVLGEDFRDVGALYAATAVGVIFVFPVQMLSQLVLSLLGGKSSFVLRGRRGWQYLVLTLVFSVAVGLVTYFAGRWLVRVLYPAQAQTALSFFHYIALTNGMLAVKQMIRPVLLKYAWLSTTVLWSGVALAVQLGAIFLLVPRYQADGAAMAMAISGFVGAVIWVAYFLRTHHRLSAAA